MSVAPVKPPTPAQSKLETRVENRKRELIAEIVEHKKNSLRSGAAMAVDKAKTLLSELARIEKESVVDGWAKVSPTARRRLDDWMAR